MRIIFCFIALAGLCCNAEGLRASADSTGISLLPAVDSATHSDAGGEPLLADADSSKADLKSDTLAGDTSVSSKIYLEYIAHPVLQVITWPLEKFVAPTLELMLVPLKPPLSYFMRENVIDRTIDLISFGTDDNLMVYPTLNLSTGTGSYTGLSLRKDGLFNSRDHRLVSNYDFYVNGDWKFRTYTTHARVFDSPYSLKFSFTFNQYKNRTAYQPRSNASIAYADSSIVFDGQITRPIFEQVVGKAAFHYRINRFGEPPTQPDPIVSPFFDSTDLTKRGFSEDWFDHIFHFGLSRDTRNNPYITVSGSQLELNWLYHLTNPAASHDFHHWNATLTKYFRLGKERYEIEGAERFKVQKIDVRSLLKTLEVQKLREQLFNRKVVVVQLFAAESYSLSGHSAPWYATNSIGDDTPLRAYTGSRFRDWSAAAMSFEYRFPVIRLMDGVVFTEYGWTAPALYEIDPWDVKNSWGFGVRVRRSDIFLFRAQLGFRTHGYRLNLTVDATY